MPKVFNRNGKKLKCRKIDGDKTECKIKDGDRRGQVKMAHGPDGTEVLELDGDMDLIKETKKEMAQMITVRQKDFDSDAFDDGRTGEL